MNTRIARQLNLALQNAGADSIKAMETAGREIVDAHNSAVRHGFLELPILEFVGSDFNDEVALLAVKPVAGVIYLEELYNLKSEWGANSLCVMEDDTLSIELGFKRK